MKYNAPLFRILIVLAFLLPGSVHSQTAQTKMNQFVSGLMAKMTVQEKIGQLNLVVGGEATTGSVVSTGVEEKIKQGKVGGIFSVSSPQRIRSIQELAVQQSRLKIPIIFGMDVIHGYRTIFPIPLGLAASWDMQRIEQSARIAAQEATADGLNWTFSPMVDISRDPRWGRISEGSGEDPFLGSAIAAAMVKGYQGKDLAADNTLLACVKHFALYGAAEAGRDYHSVDMSRIKMFNDYLPPYKAAIDAGVGTVMSSFNDVDGIPASANKWLLTDLLRKQWGFKGMVVSDYTSINEMIDHGLGDLKQVSALAVKAGLDMDMVGEGFLTTLEASLKEGKITMTDIDRACRMVLEAKYKLGLFEDPFRYCNEQRAASEIFSATHRKVARETAARSFVLLKNQGVLPLAKKGSIALVGPLADAKENMVGTWSVSADVSKATSLLAGLKEVAGSGVNVRYAKGANVTEDSALEARTSVFGKPWQRDSRHPDTLIAEAVRLALQSDVVVAAMGELAEFTGEASSRTDLNLPNSQKKLLDALMATGKPVVMVLFTGRPLTIVEEDKKLPAILNVWFGGSEAGYAISDVLFGDVNPSGKLPVTFPRNVGQIPIYYSYKNTGRPLVGDEFQKFRSNYLDVSNTPLYPFGYGLSYTKFDYSPVALSKSSLKGAEKLIARVTVTNSGKFAGEEVVQLYIRDIVASNTRPLKELKGFKKILLQPGESKEISFEITNDLLKFYDHNLRYDWEPGEFTVFIGANSRDTQSANFRWSR
ncbi:beta-glucosidase BglX [Flavihumibacter cheonanensis]|uniref:beta-glucosidase BglX n=1 Tax=Flavihumibacter cheonanensis TaxID=1442385 RepID=UPI001EF8C239|nr:beta-glucosidase BglX [Flavihumibacter cheonanensis]MCG7754769.1 beta-glucosidase BglX [Flavihumibacter cheonanensis]